ncbi:MAG: hypothetical protein CYG59_00095, partial [Chloroflexi bacterium]
IEWRGFEPEINPEEGTRTGQLHLARPSAIEQEHKETGDKTAAGKHDQQHGDTSPASATRRSGCSYIRDRSGRVGDTNSGG